MINNRSNLSVEPDQVQNWSEGVRGLEPRSAFTVTSTVGDEPSGHRRRGAGLVWRWRVMGG